MEPNTNTWNLGDVVFVPRTTRLLKKNKKNLYERIVDSQYICVRKATDNQCGILVKVLGQTKEKRIYSVCGQPFCNDDEYSLLEGMAYSSYAFPTVSQLVEVLTVIHSNPNLLSKFEAASMAFDPKSLFWAKKNSISLPFLKNLQCFNGSTNSLCSVPQKVTPSRLTIAYFNAQQEIIEQDLVDPNVEMPVAEQQVAPETEEEMPQSRSSMRNVILFICFAILLVGAFLAGKYFNSPQESNTTEIILTDSASKSEQKDTVAKTEKEDTVAKAEKKDTLSKAGKKDTVKLDKYEEMDIRVRTGGYRIIGTDRIWKVQAGEDMTRISKHTLGPGMECYIEVYNGIEPGTPLKTGQEIKIPKVELKKKKSSNK